MPRGGGNPPSNSAAAAGSFVCFCVRRSRDTKRRVTRQYRSALSGVGAAREEPFLLRIGLAPGGSGGGSIFVEFPSPKDPEIVESLLLDLLDPENKVYALSMVPEEIVPVYPALSPPTLSASAANRVCNALALLQTVAAQTRTPFLEAGIPLYSLPFLNTTSEANSFEYLRVTSLGVLGTLAKVDDSEVGKFLLKNEVIPLCLRIMGTGSELSKTVDAFIVQKITQDEVGLQHICATAECVFQAANALATMVIALTEQPSTRLLKHVIRCYHRLTDDPRACTVLQTHLPKALRNGTFDNCLRRTDDLAASNFLQRLVDNLVGPAGGGSHHGGPFQAGPSHTP